MTQCRSISDRVGGRNAQDEMTVKGRDMKQGGNTQKALLEIQIQGKV